jgi:predicted NACHT family NTPase
MKKILLLLSFFFLFTFNSTSKEIDYSLLDVSDLLKKGFKIIKQEDSGGVTKVFLTNNRDFVVCSIIMTGFSTFCTKQ